MPLNEIYSKLPQDFRFLTKQLSLHFKNKIVRYGDKLDFEDAIKHLDEKCNESLWGHPEIVLEFKDFNIGRKSLPKEVKQRDLFLKLIVETEGRTINNTSEIDNPFTKYNFNLIIETRDGKKITSWHHDKNLLAYSLNDEVIERYLAEYEYDNEYTYSALMKIPEDIRNNEDEKYYKNESELIAILEFNKDKIEQIMGEDTKEFLKLLNKDKFELNKITDKKIQNQIIESIRFSQFHHPEYHFQYGGRELINRIKKFQSSLGDMMIFESPRFNYPPMDIFLAIDFVINNFYNIGDSKKIKNDPIYKDILVRAQKRVWRPYYISMASKWLGDELKSYKISPSMQFSKLYPEH